MNHGRQQLPSQQMLRIFGSGAGVNGENNIRIWTENENSLRINHLDFQAVCKSFVYFIIYLKETESSYSMKQYHSSVVYQQIHQPFAQVFGYLG